MQTTLARWLTTKQSVEARSLSTSPSGNDTLSQPPPPSDSRDTDSRPPLVTSRDAEYSNPTRLRSASKDNHSHSTSAPNPTPSSPLPLSKPLPLKSHSSQFTKLHPNISLERCTESTIGGFKRLNALLPIPYPKKFYDETLSDPVIASVSLVALWNTPNAEMGGAKVVGGIRGRVLTGSRIDESVALGPEGVGKADTGSGSGPGFEPGSGIGTGSESGFGTQQDKMLYISTLIVSPPFRNSGIASALLDKVTATAVSEHGVTKVGAHVWIANDEARKWYAARGFAETRSLEGYYRRLNPSGAVVVERKVGVRDLLPLNHRNDRHADT